MRSPDTPDCAVRPAFPGWLTPASLAGLVLGAALGIAGEATGSEAVAAFSALIDPAGELWMGALRAAVVPLVVVQTMVAVLGTAGREGLPRVAARTFVGIVVMLVVTAAFTFTLAPLLVRLHSPDPDVVRALRSSVGLDVPGTGAAGHGGPTGWGGAALAVLQGRHILPVLLAALASAVLLLRLPERPRDRVTDAISRLSRLLLRGVAVILLATPLGVFTIVLAMALEAGVGLAGLVVAFIVMMSTLLLLATAGLYPVVALASAVPMRAFARAAVPAQIVAVSTRSSIAALPAMVEGAEELELPPAASGLVLPLAVALAKASRMVSSPFQLLFLAHVFGVSLGAGEIVSFVGTVMILSFGSVGVPGGAGGMRSLPAYVAAGIPVQGYLLANASETIPDIFKTLVNVTADLALACIVCRPGSRARFLA